jgi:DNA-binding MarR family transcriptional regulator
MRTDPVEHAQAASDFYATLGKDVSYHPAIWHTYKVGQLLIADLDRLCAERDLSMADVHLLGVVRMDRPQPLRATDLAQTLNLSNAVLSARLKRLESKGLLVRTPSPEDRRASFVSVTPEGAIALDQATDAVTYQSQFVRAFRQLSEQDRSDLGRIMGELHKRLDRDFVSAPR